MRFLAPERARTASASSLRRHRGDHRRSSGPDNVTDAERLRPLSGAGAGLASGPRDPPFEVRDRDRFDRVARLEAEDLRVERQLRLAAI